MIETSWEAGDPPSSKLGGSFFNSLLPLWVLKKYSRLDLINTTPRPFANTSGFTGKNTSPAERGWTKATSLLPSPQRVLPSAYCLFVQIRIIRVNPWLIVQASAIWNVGQQIQNCREIKRAICVLPHRRTSSTNGNTDRPYSVSEYSHQ